MTKEEAYEKAEEHLRSASAVLRDWAQNSGDAICGPHYDLYIDDDLFKNQVRAQQLADVFYAFAEMLDGG